MSDPAGSVEETLPRRDWLLLPLVVVSVLFVLLGGAEATARLMFTESGRYSCDTTDASGVGRQKPNCVATFKNAEGPVVEYRFNECGYRSSKPCGPKPPQTLRIVLVGTSITLGLYVPSDETFAVRTERALNRVCSQPVEVQNTGGLVSLSSIPARIADARRLSADAVVLTVVPFDLEKPPAPAVPQPAQSSTDLEARLAPLTSTWRNMKYRMLDQRAVFAVKHFMLLDKQILYQVFLSGGASRELMSYPPTASGEERYAEFGAILDRIMVQLKGTGIPLIVMVVPNRIAAAMESNHSHVQGVDGAWFGRHISEIAVRHGAIPLDVTQDFAAVPHAERLFYPVDNHPMAEAHAVMARALVKRLTDGTVPGLAGCASQRTGEK